MASIKITVFNLGETEPKTKVTIPLGIARVALRVMPEKASGLLKEHGIAALELADRIVEEGVTGVIAEIERPGERIVVALE